MITDVYCGLFDSNRDAIIQICLFRVMYAFGAVV